MPAPCQVFCLHFVAAPLLLLLLLLLLAVAPMALLRQHQTLTARPFLLLRSLLAVFWRTPHQSVEAEGFATDVVGCWDRCAARLLLLLANLVPRLPSSVHPRRLSLLPWAPTASMVHAAVPADVASMPQVATAAVLLPSLLIRWHAHPNAEGFATDVCGC
eukprot:NODE_12547_length_1218_cov_4.679193.p4 GENE.NODE_12547_length_1218_cov_4.679193~~NODE_12547_length_1218_cov_4.679193.p4  ORF type:complete len:160 (-),score=26.12 NODE_12547_length_1218_cov_4.679193:41-520(-)